MHNTGFRIVRDERGDDATLVVEFQATNEIFRLMRTIELFGEDSDVAQTLSTAMDDVDEERVSIETFPIARDPNLFG